MRGYIDQGIKEGAKLAVDGRALKVKGYEDGFYLGGCFFDQVTPAMKIYSDEIFGRCYRWCACPSLEDGIRLISDNEYGNGASIFTRDGGVAREFTNRVQIGMVGVKFRFRCRWRFIVSADGSAPCSAIWRCTASKGCASTPS